MTPDFIEERDGPLSFVPADPNAKTEKTPRFKTIDVPLWTYNKARLVREYLVLFVQVTRHGTYLDGFAGPQEMALLDTQAARLVLEVQQLRNFHFFEKLPAGVAALQILRAEHPDRAITVWPGDFNARIAELLNAQTIGPKEATFCLLDQRTFQCHWSSLVALAQHKPSGSYKIELFYFLAEKWLDRALHEQEDPGPPTAWWGRPDWKSLRGLSRQRRAQAFVERFRAELGYRQVFAWPILERDAAGAPVMYYMIHASDHPDAPEFMRRAYDSAVLPGGEQLRGSWRT